MAKQTLNDMLNTGHAADAADAPEPPIDPVEAVAPRPAYDPAKTFSAEETLVPRLVLAQGLSPEVRDRKADIGDWLLMGHEPIKEVRLVIAGHSTQRRYVPESQQRASCYSPDGLYGYGIPGTKEDGSHLACADCPLSKWTDTGKKDQNGRTINQRPACDEVDAFVAFSLTHGMPVVWPLKGTGAKAARFVKTLSNGLGMGNFAISVVAEGKQGNGRAWHEPVIKIDGSVSRDEANVYRDIALGAVTVAGELPAHASNGLADAPDG